MANEAVTHRAVSNSITREGKGVPWGTPDPCRSLLPDFVVALMKAPMAWPMEAKQRSLDAYFVHRLGERHVAGASAVGSGDQPERRCPVPGPETQQLHRWDQTVASEPQRGVPGDPEDGDPFRDGMVRRHL